MMSLVTVEVALTCGTDLKVWKRGYHARMIRPPAVFGHELAGTIEEMGSGCKRRFPQRYARGAGKFGALRRLPILPQGPAAIFARICSSTTALMPNTSAFPARIVRQEYAGDSRYMFPFWMRPWSSRWPAFCVAFTKWTCTPATPRW